MKRLIYVLLGLLVCLALFVLPAAAEDATEPEPTTQVQEETTEPVTEPQEETTAPEPVTEPQEETTDSEPTEPEPQPAYPPFSPYQAPNWEDYGGDYNAYYNASYEWETSVYGKYYNWSRYLNDDWVHYDPAFRAFYADDPELVISDHFVYRLRDVTRYENKKRVTTTEAYLLDYFDTAAAAEATTTLRIPAKIDGYPLNLYMYRSSYESSGLIDSGYTNDTVKKLILAEGITSVSAYAFSGFTALKEVYLPYSLTNISIGAFKNCTNLRKVEGGETLESLGSGAFSGCKRLSYFDYIYQIRYMDGAAFFGCAFKTLTLSGNASLGGGDEDNYDTANVFGNCKKLKKVTFLDGSKEKGLYLREGAFSRCEKLKTVVLPKVTKEIEIGDLAFNGCIALQTVKNTTKVRTIGRMAFQNCTSLAAITLPKNLQQADFDCFLGCKNLKTLTLHSKDTGLFDKSYEPDVYYWGDPSSFKISSNFLLALPKTTTVLVVNKAMKDAVTAHRFKGTVKIRVTVQAPATVKLARKNGAVTLTWSKVKAADGYRVWSYDPKTEKYTKLATVAAPKTSVTVKSNAKQFVVRAYRVIDKDVSWSQMVKAK